MVIVSVGEVVVAGSNGVGSKNRRTTLAVCLRLRLARRATVTPIVVWTAHPYTTLDRRGLARVAYDSDAAHGSDPPPPPPSLRDALPLSIAGVPLPLARARVAADILRGAPLSAETRRVPQLSSGVAAA